MCALISGLREPEMVGGSSHKYSQAVLRGDSGLHQLLKPVGSQLFAPTDLDERILSCSHERTFFYRVDGAEQPVCRDRHPARTCRLWDAFRESTWFLLQAETWKIT